MYVIIVRDGDRPSLRNTKTGLIADNFRTYADARLFYVCRKEEDKFVEKWTPNTLDLATSVLGIFHYFTLMQILKSPEDLRSGIIRRISSKRRSTTGRHNNFISLISEALYQYFSRSARTNRVMRFLIGLDSKKVFLIDGFFSLRTIPLKKLKALGPIVYVSTDLAYDFHGDNWAASKLMLKFERNVISIPDIVIACSERDRLKYVHIGAKKAVFYPNIRPIEFELSAKDSIPSISIVVRDHWGSKAEKSLKEVFEALANIDETVNVNVIGMKPPNVSKNIRLHHHDCIRNRSDFLAILSRSWLGINLGIHAGGTNERKYDYAMAGLVVLSDSIGIRGDLLPCEYAYVDQYDLTGKLTQLLRYGKGRITEMGLENRKQALSLAEEQREEISKAIQSFILDNKLTT